MVKAEAPSKKSQNSNFSNQYKENTLIPSFFQECTSHWRGTWSTSTAPPQWTRLITSLAAGDCWAVEHVNLARWEVPPEYINVQHYFHTAKTQRSIHLISARTCERQATVLLIFLPVLKENLTSPSTEHSSASIISSVVWHQLASVPLSALEETLSRCKKEVYAPQSPSCSAF